MKLKDKVKLLEQEVELLKKEIELMKYKENNVNVKIVKDQTPYDIHEFITEFRGGYRC